MTSPVVDDDLVPAPSREGWLLLLSQLWRQKWGLFAGIGMGLLWTVGRVSIPTFVARAIDQGIEPRDLERVEYWATVIAAVAVVTALCTGCRRYLAFREARYAEAVLRDRIFAHVVRLSFPYHDRSPTGQLMSRANLDLQQVQNFIVLVPLTIANIVTVLATAVILMRVNAPLTLIALGPLPIVMVLTKRMSTRLFPTMMQVQQESAELSGVVEETVSGIRVVKGFGAESVQAGRLATEADDVYGASMEGAYVRARYWPSLDLLPVLGLVAVLAYGGHLVIDNELSIGELVGFNAYIALLVWPLRMLGWIVAMTQRAVASAGRVSEVLATEVEVAESPSPVPLPEHQRGAEVGHVRFAGVHFAYPGSNIVLDDFSLEIPPGQSVAVVGATGSGKSTLARVLCRFYDIQSGSLTLDGVAVRDVSLHDLRRAVGLVFEDTFLFSDTIAGNIAFAEPDADMQSVEAAARLAGAHDFITNLPHSYDTLIGERGYSLSGGQRQRIAIARAILADPRVLILDDATSAVDPNKEHEIRGALEEVIRDRTTIVIAHRPATIALAERVVLIHDGRVAADGTHQSLLETTPRYREVLAAAEEAEREALEHVEVDGDEAEFIDGIDRSAASVIGAEPMVGGGAS